MSEPGGFSVGARARSFRYAIRGIVTMLRSQHNAWIHAVVSGAVIAAGLAVHLAPPEWGLIVVVMAGVWAAEAVNTAVEALCDVVSPAPHPLVERAKDIAAGAVLIAAIAATVVGALVFVPHLLGRAPAS